MKTLKRSLLTLAVFAFVLTSCSKGDGDEDTAVKGKVNFGTVLQNLVTKSKKGKSPLTDIPDCSGETPAYAMVVVEGPENVGTVAEPFRVDINPTPFDQDGDGNTEFVTVETTQLSVRAGTYSLTYFAVYDASDNPIWVAPQAETELANFVPEALPLSFDVAGGDDNYVPVDVLCFDNRNLLDYGAIYFALIPNQAIEFCIQGNYCAADVTYDANFSVNIWTGTDNTGNVIYAAEANADGAPLCLPMPDLSGEDSYYLELTLEDATTYGDVDNLIIRQGVFTDADIKDLFEGDSDVYPYVFNQGCGLDDKPVLFEVVNTDTTPPGDTDPEGLALPFIDTFEAYDPDNLTAPYDSYQSFVLAGQSDGVGNRALGLDVNAGNYAGPIANRPNDGTVTSDAGLDFNFNAGSNSPAEDAIGTVYTINNAFVTPQFAATDTDVIDFTMEMQYTFPENLSNVSYYYSTTYDGTSVPDFSGAEWTVIDFTTLDTGNFDPADDPSGTEETKAEMEAQGFAGADWKVKEATFTPGGSFYIAIRYFGTIEKTAANRDRSRFRFDNLTVEKQ